MSDSSGVERGVFAGILVAFGANAVSWFITPMNHADASTLRIIGVAIQAVLGLGIGVWLIAREHSQRNGRRAAEPEADSASGQTKALAILNLTASEQKLFETYSTSLSKAWESYIKLIDLLIGLSGATALVFVGSIKVSQWQNLPNRRFIVLVFVSSGLSLACGILWRFASHHFMEYETLGGRSLAETYFSTGGIKPVTKAHQPQRLRGFYRAGYRFLPFLTSLLLVSSWALIFFVFFG